VSIQNVRQEGLGEEASLIVRTHLATDASLAATIEDLRQSDAVRQVQGVMRVEGEYGP
jgi:homoserine dehydrogenase